MTHGQLDSVGGMTAISELDAGTPRIVNLDSWVRLIQEKSDLRKLIFVCQRTIDRCLTGEQPGDVLEMVRPAIERLDERISPTAGLSSVKELAGRIGVEGLLNPSAGARRAVPLPWPSLSRLIPGLKAGQMIVLAARPGLGKSAAAAQIALTAALDGFTVAMFSLEMPSEDIVRRVISGMAPVDLCKIQQGGLDVFEREAARSALNNLVELPVYFSDSATVTVTGIYAALRRLQTRSAVGLVVVDYLQLVESVGRHDTRNSAVAELSRGLKKLALEFNIPVLVLSQLSRENEKQQRRPMLSDLRDSGAIEQDADIITFLHPLTTDQELESGEVEFIVAKHRNGRRGKVRLRFHGPQTRFEEAI